MDIRRQKPDFYREYDDKKSYYLKNDHGNILEVTKVILMERFGFIFTTAKETAAENREGMWKKKLPAEEGFDWVTQKEWQDLENERLKITPQPTAAAPKMGPDEGRFNPPADPEAEARARAEEEAKAAAAEEEAAKTVEDEARAKAEADKGEQT